MLATTAPTHDGGSKALEDTSIDPTDEDEMPEIVNAVRKSFPKDDFAYVDENGEGHLPIHDEEHVKNALARLNQTDISVAAKRKALRKILRAAKKFGVEVDKDSDVMKQYGALHHHSMEQRRQLLAEALNEQFDKDDDDKKDTPSVSSYYISETFDDYVIAERGRRE